MTRKKFNKRLTVASMLILLSGLSTNVLAEAVDASTATLFHVDSNPIIKDSVLNHFSSDPSVTVITDTTTLHDALVLVSSSDLKNVDITNKWPMNQTYLYATYGSPTGDALTTNWFDHGPVVNESGFTWVTDYPNHTYAPNHLWAPDIQYFPDASNLGGQIWFYVPDIDPYGTQRIGMTHIDHGFGLYEQKGDDPFNPNTGGFQVEPAVFNIMPGASNLLPPNNGFAFDPGVFLDDHPENPSNNKYYMVYVDNGYVNNQGGNLSMVAINGDRKSGTYLGKVHFSGPLQGYSGLSAYMEGPDVYTLYAYDNGGATARKYYYLVFSANVEDKTVCNNLDDNCTGYIGYAMCKPSDFSTNPTGCWQFKGWIFRNAHTGRSNQASLVHFQSKNYVFYHRIFSGDDPSTSRSRQICAKEFEIRSHVHSDGTPYDDDGEIIGVTHPNPSAGDSIETTTLYGTLDDTTKGLTKGFAGIQDDYINSGGNAQITVSSFKNITDDDLSNFQLYYYLNVESGQNLHVDPIYNSNSSFQLASPAVKHINQNTWAVVLNYSGSSIPAGNSLSGVNAQFNLHYDSPLVSCGSFLNATLCYTFDKTNDFSQPLGNYPTFTTRVGLFDSKNNWIAGEVPDTGSSTDAFKVLRTEHPDKNNLFTYLTASTPKANDGINNQYLSTSSVFQDWVIESVGDLSNFTGLPQLTDYDKAHAVRLRNKQTGYYMTCNDSNKGSYSQPLYLLLDQVLNSNPKWATQLWIVESVGDGSSRLRSAWIPSSDKNAAPVSLYLTLNINNNYDSGWQNVYVQPFNGNWDTQRWIIE